MYWYHTDRLAPDMTWKIIDDTKKELASGGDTARSAAANWHDLDEQLAHMAQEKMEQKDVELDVRRQVNKLCASGVLMSLVKEFQNNSGKTW